jgi:hypothetical protein
MSGKGMYETSVIKIMMQKIKLYFGVYDEAPVF